MTDFLIFKRNNEIYVEITQHSKHSCLLIEERVKKFFSLDNTEQQHELDLYHKIFKHARACEEADCTAQQGSQLIQRLIIQDILPNIRALRSYPLLLCMIDLVKNNPTSLDRDTLSSFISLTRNLWQHEKIYICRKSMELCRRMVPLLESGSEVLTSILKYILACRKNNNMTRLDLERIRSLNYTEFYYTTPSHNMTFDRECIKLLVQIVLSVFLHHPMDLADNIHQFISEIKESLGSFDDNSQDFMTVLFDICCANDDDTVQLLDTILSLYQQKNTSTLFVNFLKEIDLNPHTLFLFFLSRCGNTHDIIIDLLLENDSEFLSYFYRYIAYASSDLANLIVALQQQEEDIFTIILANTISVLQGDGFPYNVKPLVRRLTLLEDQLSDSLFMSE